MQDLTKIEELKSDMPVLLTNPARFNPLLIRSVKVFFSVFGRIWPSQAARLAYRLFSTPRSRARHRVSDPVLEQARIFEFLYGKQILKGYEWGRGDKVVLLVHGWESRGTALRSFVPPLLEKGYRVITFDGPAHGNSSGKRTNLPHFSGAVRAIINQVGGVESIITHSFGGASTVYTLVNDESIKIDKLVLIGVPGQMTNLLQYVEDFMGLPRPAFKHFIKIIEKILKMPLGDVDVSKAWGRMSVKNAMIVHDRMDPVVPFSSALEIHRGWENTLLLQSNGYGHYQLIKNPDLVQRVIHFISNPEKVLEAS